ncbi:hypothetical protein [Kaarinaea lacus]
MRAVKGSPAEDSQKDLKETLISQYYGFSGWSVYLYGNSDMVNATKHSVFLAGASLQDVYADPFLHSKLRRN